MAKRKRDKLPPGEFLTLSSNSGVRVLEFPDLPLPRDMRIEDLIPALEKVGSLWEVSLCHPSDAELTFKRHGRVLAKLEGNPSLGNQLIDFYGMYYDGSLSELVERGGKRQKYEALVLACQRFSRWAKVERGLEEE